MALFSRARHAILAGARALELRPGDEILVPAYHHGSEIEALVRAGLVPRFYEASETLEPDEVELDRLLGVRTRALYLIHYLGFPQDARRWRGFCDERGLLLLEDAAQAWLASREGEPVGSSGDLAVFCLYKTFGLPDGAALVVRGAPAAAPRSGIRGMRPVAARHALWLAQQSALMARVVERMERDVDYRPEDDFALGAVSSPASSTRLLIPRLGAEAAARRRAHYRLLLEELRRDVPPPFDRLPGGASPFVFPIRTERKRELIDRLVGQGIRPLDLWSAAHPALPADRFPAAQSRRATTVGLPVHQELRAADVERVAGVIRATARQRQPALEWSDDTDAFADVWRRLAARSANIFLTWEWASLWWRLYGSGLSLRPALCRTASGEPFALLPLVGWRERPLEIVRLLGFGPADELGPVCAPEHRPAAARCLRRALDELGADCLLADHLLGGEGWPAMLDGVVVRREGFPLLRAPGGWEGYVAARGSLLRGTILRKERKLARERRLRYRLADDPARLDADLDTLFALHRARWPQRTGFTEHEGFHREFAALALERGWLRLWLLELGDTPVAAWYGFRFGGIESYYQSGRAPGSERDSVGSILLAHTIREAVADGVREYRLLRGGENYKQVFATEDPGVETVAVARSALGRAAVAAGRLAATVAPIRHALGAATEP